MQIQRLWKFGKHPFNASAAPSTHGICHMFYSMNLIHVCLAFRNYQKRHLKSFPKSPKCFQHDKVPTGLHNELIRINLTISTVLCPIKVVFDDVANLSPLECLAFQVTMFEGVFPFFVFDPFRFIQWRFFFVRSHLHRMSHRLTDMRMLVSILWWSEIFSKRAWHGSMSSKELVMK